jgi:hypothetical protein
MGKGQLNLVSIPILLGPALSALRPWRWLIVLTVIFFLIRLPFLDSFFFLHDERDIALSGASIAQTGKDLYGTIFPLYFKNISPDNPLVAIWWSAIWYTFSPEITVWNTRMGALCISSLLPFVLYLVLTQAKVPKRLILFILSTIVFSPWIWHLTRLNMDITTASLTILAGIAAHLSGRRMIAYFFYALSFFNYQGFRPTLPFVIVYIELYLVYIHQKITLFLTSVGKGIFVVLVFFMISMHIESGLNMRRSAQIVFFATDSFTKEIDHNRRFTYLTYPHLAQFMHNKFIATTDSILQTAFEGINPRIFFKQGDPNQLNGIGYGGLFFLFQLPLFLLGFAQLSKAEYRSVLWLTGFIVVGMITSIIRIQGTTFAIRGFLMILGYGACIGLGAHTIYQWIVGKAKLIRVPLLSIFCIIILINIWFITYNYTFNLRYAAADTYFGVERTIAQIPPLTPSGQIVYFAPDVRDWYLSAVVVHKQPLTEVQRSLKNGAYKLNNRVFLPCDKMSSDSFDSNTRYIVSLRCYAHSKQDALMADTDTSVNFYTSSDLSGGKKVLWTSTQTAKHILERGPKSEL